MGDMRTPSNIWTSLASRIVVTTALVTVVCLAPTEPARAATITATTVAGYREVTINGYGARGLGTFTLRSDSGDPEPGSERMALCIEADSRASTVPGAYRLVPNVVDSPELDYLLWKYGTPGTAEYTEIGGDHDTAIALAALAWYYADASRRNGHPVWSNPASGFGRITPAAPNRWSDLPQYTSAFPVGLRSGGIHLDAAERRVYEMYHEAAARRGPWTMSPVVHSGGRASVTVTGPAGPIANVGGVRFVVRDRHGAAVSNTVVRTNGNGTASVDVPELLGGGSIEASMFAPGVHQEWDGDGDVQRLSTGTTARLDRQLTVEPAALFVRIAKQSSDPAFSPAGATFALLDADGRTISTATTDSDGTATFAPVPHSAHPGPFRVRETGAPPGLAASPDDIAVPEPISTDASSPTVVTLVNHPVTRNLSARKVLSDPAVGPPDRSGFSFEVTREADGRSFGTIVTGVYGRAGPIPVTGGRFVVCERDRPRWSAGLEDGGCQTVEVTTSGSGGGDGTVEVVYTNIVPTPTISTRVHDAADGDQMLAATGGRLVDVVSYRDLVPGTEYRLVGEIQRIDDDGVTASGIGGTITFVPDEPDGIVEVDVDVPADAGIAVGVMYQHLSLNTIVDDEVTGDVVAEHTDPDDVNQTFWVPAIDTSASLTPDGLVDEVTFRGLPPGDYTATVTWNVRTPDGACVATDLTHTESFTVDHHEGIVQVGPTPLGDDHDGATLVAFQSIHRAETDDTEADDTETGDAEGDDTESGDPETDGTETGDTETEDTEGDGTETETETEDDRVPVAVHHDCDAAGQTVEIPARPVAPTTQPAAPVASPTTTSVASQPPTTPATAPETTVAAESTTTTTTTTTTTVGRPAAVSTAPTQRPLPTTGPRSTPVAAALALMGLGAGALGVLTAMRSRQTTDSRRARP